MKMRETESHQAQSGVGLAPEFKDGDEVEAAPSKLNTLNVLNLTFYIINSAITYGMFANPNRRSIPEKYQVSYY